MASLDHHAIKQIRGLGGALKDATPAEVLTNLEKFFRMYGEQPATMEDAAGYIRIARDAIVRARNASRSG